MDYYIELGKIFRKRRLELKMMQVEVAEMADISNNFYSNIERGRTKLSVESLMRILKALQLSIDPLIFDDELSKNEACRKTIMRDLDNMLKDKNKSEIKSMISFCNTFAKLLEHFNR